MSEFIRSDDEYVRDINVVDGYYEQLCMYMHKSSGLSMDKCKEWVSKEFKEGGRFYTPSPIAKVTVRDKETGDRKSAQVPMTKLLMAARRNDLIISPSMTFYVPAKHKLSLLAVFIDENIQKRAKIKTEMFVAVSENNAVLAQNKDNEQNSVKQRNNALSGAHSSPYTILYNKSTHSSLTSMCRSATSYGNANNEKLLAGSRHYWSPGIVISNILATLTITDFDMFEKCISHYNMYLPTVEETMECIRYSTKLFWRNGRAMDRIRELVEKLSGLERAAFVYIGDLYHVRMYNDALMKDFLTDLLQKDCELKTSRKEVEARLDGDTIALVALLRNDAMKESKDFRSVKKRCDVDYDSLMATCEHIYDTTEHYSLFIKEIMTTNNVPASIAKMPETIRRVSLVSDTDSTMATAQGWAEWFCDGEMTGKAADDISDMMIYIATQNIAHMMARMSTQMGVENKHRHRYAMKNEFKFSSFSLTNKAKHYFSLITSREGVLKDEPELEVKGVALRTSNIPPIIMNEFNQRLHGISADVMNGRKIKIIPYLRRIAEIEQSIIDSLMAGKFTYLKTGNIKVKSAYTKPESSAYVYYGLWEETFGPKYGSSGEPTFNVVKISVSLGTKTQIKRWLDGMEDKALAGRIRKWCMRNPKRTFKQFLLPESIVAVNGIPKEILDVADTRRIVFASVEPYYHVLESLGIYMIDENRTRLLSDTFAATTSIIDTDVIKEAA